MFPVLRFFTLVDVLSMRRLVELDQHDGKQLILRASQLKVQEYSTNVIFFDKPIKIIVRRGDFLRL